MYYVGKRTNGKTFAVQSRDRIPEDAMRIRFDAVLPPGGKSRRMTFDGPNVFATPAEDRKTALKRFAEVMS